MRTRLLARRVPLVGHVVGKDLAVGHAAALHHVEHRLVRREAQPVGPQHALGRHRQPPRRRIDAVHVGIHLGLGLVALVVAEDAEHRVREPHRAVRFHHHIVGRVEALAREVVGQHRDGAVVLGADDAPAAVLAGDEATLAVAGVAVGEVGGLAEHADGTRLLLPLQDAVVGDVAPQQVAPVADPHRPLRPAAAGGEALHAGELEPVPLERRIERDDGGVWIARGLLPAVGEGWDGRRRLAHQCAPCGGPSIQHATITALSCEASPQSFG